MGEVIETRAEKRARLAVRLHELAKKIDLGNEALNRLAKDYKDLAFEFRKADRDWRADNGYCLCFEPRLVPKTEDLIVDSKHLRIVEEATKMCSRCKRPWPKGTAQ